MSDRQALNRNNASIETTSPERIVQFGAGNFIRAFADWIIQELNEQTKFDASVVVVKVTPHSIYEILDKQDGLFHVHTEGIQAGEFVSSTKLISCITRTVYPYIDHEAYLDLARQTEVRILISNTTEAGISYHENDLFEDTPPSSFPAKLTQFLYERYQHFDGAPDKGCIVLPTELVVDNGSQLKAMILRYAGQWQLDREFSEWINQHNIFCNTLVDRIVPGYPDDKANAILDKIDYEDGLLVMGEPYHSFVIAGPDAITDELPFYKTNLNVKIVDSVDHYRQIKVRILNGLHTSMVSIGLLLGLESVRESVEHPVLGTFLRHEAAHDIIPSMDIDENELKQFASDVFDRFLNPSVHHRLINIAMNSSTKIRTRILPTILAYHAKFGLVPPRMVLVFAAFIRLYKGEWQGVPIPLNDDASVLQWFAEQWESCQTVESLVTSVLKRTDLWQADLTQINGLHTQLCGDLIAIENGQLEARLTSLNG